MKLENLNIILTGAGRGIGRILSRKLDEEGARLALISRTKKELIETRNQLQNKNSFYSMCDISDEEAVNNTFSKILERFNQKVDVLINNAGVQFPIGLFNNNKNSDWKKNIEINLFGTINCAKCVLPFMIENKSGKIINFSGGGSTSPRPYFSAYGVSKTAIVRFTETISVELKDFNIDINAVAPGAINTSMLDEIIHLGDLAGKEYNDALKRAREGGDDPQKIAELVTFLSSNLSDGISGKLISAVWDPWRDVGFQEKLKNDKNLATLRRIDNKYFVGVK